MLKQNREKKRFESRIFPFALHSLFIFLSSSSLFGNQNIWLRIKEKYKKVNTIQGNFSQRVCSEAEGSCEEFQGYFYAQKPNLLRVEVKKPKSQLIIADGESLSISVEEKEMGKVPLKETPPFLLFFALLKDSFNIQVKPNKNRVSLQLTPVDTSYYSLFLGINQKNLLIEEIKFEDWEGNKTEILFSNLIINKRLSKRLFQKRR
ncbi:MAG: outer membrane lipoprotein carrier protein LolA [candidate division WOR-3 bacterium]